MEPLQPLTFRKSPYARPNQDWVCGRQKDGQACSRGPDNSGHCQGGSECRPLDRDGRWECTRPESAGGRCTDGPLPAGSCSRGIIPCRPERSWKSRRRVAARWAVAALVGVILFMVGIGNWHSFIEPGPLTNAHARIEDCKTCHGAAIGNPLTLVASAFAGATGTHTDSERCVQCHSIGANPFAPHGMSADEIVRMRETPGASGGDAAMPVALQMARMLKPHDSDKIECAVCHREHRGSNIVQTASTNANGRCQVCHASAFTSLAKGHPEFANYPAKRRTRINFDHAAHIGKYFAEKAELAPPKNCTTCHEPDAKGKLMLVNSFAANCASCHDGDVEGSKRSGSKGVAFLQLPGLDLAGLRKRGVAIGDWPEFAEAKLSPLTDLLLSSDPAYRSARARLLKIDLLDLPDREHDADVQTLVWSMKKLVDDLQIGGGSAFESRLVAALEKPLTPEQKRDLTGRIPAAVVDSAQREWFPHLADDLKRHAAGLATPLAVIRPTPVKKAEEEPKAEEKVSTASFDSLFGGGLFGKSAEPVKPVEEPKAKPERKALSAEERMPFGGWYRDDYALRYRPTGHSDALLRSWLDAPLDPLVFDALADAKKSPGACTKCHSVDDVAGGASRVNWAPARSDPQMHPITTFSHVKHFSLLGDKGCATCHQLDRKAEYQAAFETRDPSKFASNFTNVQRETCVECHTPKGAGDDCTVCHQFHVGRFMPTLPASALDKILEMPAKR